jgi:uncharacterized membrane protein YqjE
VAFQCIPHLSVEIYESDFALQLTLNFIEVSLLFPAQTWLALKFLLSWQFFKHYRLAFIWVVTSGAPLKRSL